MLPVCPMLPTRIQMPRKPSKLKFYVEWLVHSSWLPYMVEVGGYFVQDFMVIVYIVDTLQYLHSTCLRLTGQNRANGHHLAKRTFNISLLCVYRRSLPYDIIIKVSMHYCVWVAGAAS